MNKRKKILFLGLDAAMPDLLKKFSAEGVMPNFKKLMDSGIFSRVETVFPPLTAAGWSAIVTGAGCGTAGIPSLMVKLPGEELDHWHTSFDRNMLLAETLWEVGEREGLKTALINWPVTFPIGAVKDQYSTQIGAALNPPFRYFYMPLWDIASSALFATERFACNQIPGRAVIVKPAPAEGWKNLPKSALPPLAFSIAVPPVYVKGYDMQVLIFAEGSSYDTVLVCEEKDGAAAVSTLKKGQIGPWITKNFDARDKNRNGRFYFQLIDLSADATFIKLYQSAINTADSYTIPENMSAELDEHAGVYMEVDDPWACMDQWIPPEVYIDQLRRHADWWGKATRYTLEHREWDMAYSWVGTIDHIQHMLYAGIVPQSRIYDPNKAEWCMESIREAYRQVDRNIGHILGGINLEETIIAIVSDHGFTHLDWNPYVKEWLSRAGLLKYVLDLTNDDPSNLSIDWSQTSCHPLEPCHAHIFINLKGRDPHGIVEPEDYEKVQQKIIRALYGITNPETGESAVAIACTRKEAATLGIVQNRKEGLDRVGDVVYAWKPGYMSHPFIYRVGIKYRDGTERITANPELMEQAVLGRNFTGVHLCLPSEPDMHAVMVLSGAGLPAYERSSVGRIIDIAPTVARLLDIPVPKDAEGGVMYDIMDRI
ncbi:alkaline phosphatase family protein [Treponema sp. OttesenSCG-928-L16]|nr:alkaline phosphatase family protein [Treponema sp. OttesenSCG-928-L16]